MFGAISDGFLHPDYLVLLLRDSKSIRLRSLSCASKFCLLHEKKSSFHPRYDVF